MILKNKIIKFRHILQINYFVTQRLQTSYIQGQSPEPRVREYFYYIDHQGMLFLDDARMKNFTSCFKDKKFLEFFFKRIYFNDTGRYVPHFPFISICGRERNFIKCDDLPIVYNHIVIKDEGGISKKYLSYGHAGELLMVPFEPNKIFMSVENGRVYHPAFEHVGGIGLVQSKLAIEFSKYFKFDDGDDKSPSHFTWENITYILDKDWYKKYFKLLKNRNIMS